MVTGSMFGKKGEPGISASDILAQLNEMDRRLKMLEERYTDLSRRIDFVDRSLIDERRNSSKEARAVNSEITEVKGELNGLKGTIERMISEFRAFARKEDLDALKKYVGLWELTEFATRNEVEKMIQEALENK